MEPKPLTDRILGIGFVSFPIFSEQDGTLIFCVRGRLLLSKPNGKIRQPRCSCAKFS